MKILNSKYFFIISIVILTIVYLDKSNKYFGFSNSEKKVAYPVISDGSGYYAYLPQWFIYKTDNFEFIDSVNAKYEEARFTDNFGFKEDGTRFDKYFVGTAILQSPSFLIAHFLASVFGFENDGYSSIYQIFVVLNAFVFAFIGFYFICKILNIYGIGNFAKLTTILAIGFGTNLGYYVVYYPSYSHIFSFATISYFVYLLYDWRLKKYPIKKLYFIAFVLGIIFIVRPTNAIVILLLPFYFPSLKSFLEYVKMLFSRDIFSFLFSLLLFVVPIFFQFLSTYQQLGVWALNNYSNEHFDYLLDPQFFNVLFSYDKGLFIFAPVLLLSILGIKSFFRVDKMIGIGFVITFFIFLYITSSWWCWWYGGGLGMRPFIDSLVLFAIPFGIYFDKLTGIKKTLFFSVTLVLVQMYQVYQYQMIRNILHYDRMTKEQFFSVFMKKGNRFEWCMHRQYDSIPNEKPRFVKRENIINGNLVEFQQENYDDDLMIHVSIDSTFNKWVGSISGDLKIIGKHQNPNFIVKYFQGENLVKEEVIYFGNLIPKVCEYSPLRMNFDPKMDNSKFDNITIQLIEADRSIYFKQIKFVSRYY